MMREYHKIDGLYMRDEATKRLLPGQYRNPAVTFLKNCEWVFTEKIDGTNIRVHWDGHQVSFAGRTDRAEIPSPLSSILEDMFGGNVNEQIFEQHFGEKEVTLYGEGYGAKIQSGGNYRPDQSFILFDVCVNGIWLSRENVEAVAGYFGVDVVPIIFRGTIQQAEEYVHSYPKSKIGTAMMEGLVGRPSVELLTASGRRVIVKIKADDYRELAFLHKQLKKARIALFRAENKTNADFEIMNLNAKIDALNYLTDLVLDGTSKYEEEIRALKSQVENLTKERDELAAWKSWSEYPDMMGK